MSIAWECYPLFCVVVLGKKKIKKNSFVCKHFFLPIWVLFAPIPGTGVLQYYAPEIGIKCSSIGIKTLAEQRVMFLLVLHFFDFTAQNLRLVKVYLFGLMSFVNNVVFDCAVCLKNSCLSKSSC